MESPDVKWLHPFADVFVDMLPENCGRVLDVGCGRGIAGLLIDTYRTHGEIVGVDAFEPYLKHCRTLPFYTVQFHDVSDYLDPFQDKSFDLAVCLEVLEHLHKPDGYKLMYELKRVSNKVIISTPNTFSQQPAYDENDLQHHRSVYTAKELARNDFRVSFVRVGKARIVLRGRRLPRIASMFSNGFLLGEWNR